MMKLRSVEETFEYASDTPVLIGRQKTDRVVVTIRTEDPQDPGVLIIRCFHTSRGFTQDVTQRVLMGVTDHPVTVTETTFAADIELLEFVLSVTQGTRDPQEARLRKFATEALVNRLDWGKPEWGKKPPEPEPEKPSEPKPEKPSEPKPEKAPAGYATITCESWGLAGQPTGRVTTTGQGLQPVQRQATTTWTIRALLPKSESTEEVRAVEIVVEAIGRHAVNVRLLYRVGEGVARVVGNFDVDDLHLLQSILKTHAHIERVERLVPNVLPIPL